jgi:hypothetical protein
MPQNDECDGHGPPDSLSHQLPELRMKQSANDQGQKAASQQQLHVARRNQCCCMMHRYPVNLHALNHNHQRPFADKRDSAVKHTMDRCTDLHVKTIHACEVAQLSPTAGGLCIKYNTLCSKLLCSGGCTCRAWDRSKAATRCILALADCSPVK